MSPHFSASSTQKSYQFSHLTFPLSTAMQLSEQTQISTQQSHRQHMSAVDKATAEIERFREILHQIDELELEFDRIRRIQEIVSNFKTRVATLERRLGR
ncbi:hypothetical protein TWF694_010661 [Orbilia ellipsospora]|uniref:Biogenesis of lysosome-related organelles complex 1 subunit CNL1 n=1 Tax=Orbilia ellipsospora TaxID=2528407 RepID=A0AAV9X7V7_9PEZI